jgi:predicted transcriptional regulator
MGKRIDDLEESGLIHITVDRFNKNTNWIELTNKGRDISVMLVNIYRRMNEP